MKKYTMPIMDIMMFDEEDEVTMLSSRKGTYSAHQLNKAMFEDENVNATTTIKLQDVLVR